MSWAINYLVFRQQICVSNMFYQQILSDALASQEPTLVILLVSHTFRFPLHLCVWTVTEHSWVMGRDQSVTFVKMSTQMSVLFHNWILLMMVRIREDADLGDGEED